MGELHVLGMLDGGDWMFDLRRGRRIWTIGHRVNPVMKGRASRPIISARAFNRREIGLGQSAVETDGFLNLVRDPGADRYV